MSCTFSLFFAPDFDRRDGWGRSWTFCHNGDLKGFQPRLTGVFMPLGQTDSERAFCWLMQELQATLGNGAAPGLGRGGAAAGRAVRRHRAPRRIQLPARRWRGAVCPCQHAAAWLQRHHPFGRVRLIDRDMEIDLALANGADDRMVLVATEP